MSQISILVVEDEAMTAMFMTTMLKRKGYNVLKSVSSGEEAVNFAINSNPDVILMDIRLSGKMNGIEAVIIIKEKLSNPVQFIFATGYSDTELMEEAMSLQPLGFLIKPVNFPELIRIIEFFFKK